MNFSNLLATKANNQTPSIFWPSKFTNRSSKLLFGKFSIANPKVVNVGSYESWADEESLINGVDSSLEQTIKVIVQPKRVIFGFPDSWMADDKIHPTKIKLVSRLCKELGLEPIGAVTINRAVAHFLKNGKVFLPPPFCSKFILPKLPFLISISVKLSLSKKSPSPVTWVATWKKVLPVWIFPTIPPVLFSPTALIC